MHKYFKLWHPLGASERNCLRNASRGSYKKNIHLLCIFENLHSGSREIYLVFGCDGRIKVPEQNDLYNSGTGLYEESFYEIILNSSWVHKRKSFKSVSIQRFGGQIVQRIKEILEKAHKKKVSAQIIIIQAEIS